MIGDGKPITSDGRFTLSVTASAKFGEDVVERVGPTAFTWRISPDEAMVVAEKLQALVTSNIPGHHYFGRGGGAYQTIVVTKNEEPLNVIRAMRDGTRWSQRLQHTKS